MATVAQAPTHGVEERELQPILRRAHRTWTRAGVAPVERRRLSDELHGELLAAIEAGQSSSTVLGENPTATLRQWATERNVSGQTLRIGVLAPLTVISVLIGSLVLVTNQIVETVVPGAPFIRHGAVWLAVLISSTVVSWALATLSCWAVLHSGGDPRAASTARWLFTLLPVGAMVALLLDVLIAAISGTEGPFLQLMAIATVATFATTSVIARYLATRYSRAIP